MSGNRRLLLFLGTMWAGYLAKEDWLFVLGLVITILTAILNYLASRAPQLTEEEKQARIEREAHDAWRYG